MRKIELLDCTLRDGGHVIDWNFGAERISKIIRHLNDANLDYLEIGFLRDISSDSNRSLFSTIDQANALIEGLDINTNIALMIRPDWIKLEALPVSTGVRSIRFAFYKRDFELLKRQVEIAKKANYKVFLNPINVLSYSQESLEQMLRDLNTLGPDGVAIVDTFGALLPQDLRRIIPTFEDCLNNEIKLGIHLHENLSLSFALALSFLDQVSETRDVVIDSSALGIGRVPGNLPTELIADYLNKYHDKNLKMDSILACVEDEIQPLRVNHSWGYSPEYMISGICKAHRSYAEYLREKVGCSLPEINSVIKKIASNGMEANFDEKIAHQILEERND